MNDIIYEKIIDYKSPYQFISIPLYLILEYDSLIDNYKVLIYNSIYEPNRYDILFEETFKNKYLSHKKFKYLLKNLLKDNNIELSLLKLNIEICLCKNNHVSLKLKDKLMEIDLRLSVYDSYTYEEHDKLFKMLSYNKYLLDKFNFDNENELNKKPTSRNGYIDFDLTNQLPKLYNYILLKDIDLNHLSINHNSKEYVEKRIGVVIKDDLIQKHISQGTYLNYSNLYNSFSFFQKTINLNSNTCEHFQFLKIEYLQEIPSKYLLSINLETFKIEVHMAQLVKKFLNKNKTEIIIKEYEINLSELFKDNKNLKHCFVENIIYYLRLMQILDEEFDFIFAKNFDMIESILNKFKNLISKLEINEDKEEIKYYILETGNMFKEMYESNLSICNEIQILTETMRQNDKKLLEEQEKMLTEEKEKKLNLEKKSYLQELTAMKEVYKQQK